MDSRGAFVREVARIDDPPAIAGNVAGHRARRLIDGSEPAFTDPFLALAEDWMPPGAFPVHPHRGIETVTFVIEGAVEHSDSGGHSGLLHEGDAQWMTAGRGLLHEETVPEGSIAHTLQLWVNLPRAAKMTEPRYQDLRGAEARVRREPGVEARIFSGRSADVAATTLNHVPITMIDARIKAGAGFRHTLPASDNAFVHVLDGVVSLGDSATRARADQLVWLTRSDAHGSSEIRIAADESARILLFAGPPLREPVVFGGPFVMNTEAEIRKAFADYRAGKF